MPEEVKPIFNITEVLLISFVGLITLMCIVSWLFMDKTNTEALLLATTGLGYLGAKAERYAAKMNARRNSNNSTEVEPDETTPTN